MSGTSRGCHTLLGAAAVVLLAGCGGGGYGSDSSATTTTAEAAGTGNSEFCTKAADIDQRVDDGLAKLDDEDFSLSDGFRQLADELRALDAPAAISSDVAALGDGLDRMADAVDDVDITDPGTLAALDDADGKLSAASDKVQTFLSDECGIE